MVDVAHLELTVRGAPREQARHRVATLPAVVLVDQVEDARRQQVRLAAPHDLHQRAVHAEHVPVDRGERHADRRVFERAAEPLLRLAQVGLGAPAVGEVTGADDDALDARVVEQVGADRFDEAPRSVGVGEAHFEAVDVTAVARGVEARGGARPVVGVHEVEHGGADERLRLEAERSLGRGAHVGDEPVAVDDRHDVGGVAHHGPEARLVALQQAVHLRDGLGGAPSDDPHRRERDRDQPADREQEEDCADVAHRGCFDGCRAPA